MAFDFDLIVIGAGSGGTRASRMAAQSGAKVAIIETGLFGGTCVNVGCVPKKLFAMGAHYADDFLDAKGFGWNLNKPTFDWPTLRDNTTQEVQRLNGIYRSLLEKNNVTVFVGNASLEDAHTVNVNNKSITAERILIATGSIPFMPTYPGHELAVSSNEMFYLEKLPQELIVTGAGYIAVEFASIFANLGVKVTLLHRGPGILRGFDDDIRQFLMESMQHRNITIKLNCHVASLHKKANQIVVTTEENETYSANLVLSAIGRIPHTAGLNLHQVGVRLSLRGAICVNEYYQSSIPSIYALGDVIDKVQLTPVAITEAMAFVATQYLNKPTVVDYNSIPTAVFSNPNIGTVGLTECKAREIYGEVVVYKSTFRALKHTISGRDEKTFMKVIVEAKTDKVLGVHMVGADAGEIIQGFAVAVKMGATKAQFDATVGIHPTVAEELVTMR
jgi:glutathione reductase (NADPH)